MSSALFKPRPSLQTVQSNMRDWVAQQVPEIRRVPEEAIPFAKYGFLQVPAYGNGNLVCFYTVRANWAGLIDHIVLQYQGPAPAPLPGDIQWIIDVDRGFSGIGEGYFERNYGDLRLPSLGTWEIPWPVAFRHRDNETVRVKAKAIQNVATGPGAFFTAALMGWEWPENQAQ